MENEHYDVFKSYVDRLNEDLVRMDDPVDDLRCREDMQKICKFKVCYKVPETRRDYEIFTDIKFARRIIEETENCVKRKGGVPKDQTYGIVINGVKQVSNAH